MRRVLFAWLMLAIPIAAFAQEAGERIDLIALWPRHDQRIDCAAADRMQHMIDDLLEAHRIRAGESLRLHVGACNLSAVAREVVDELSSVYGNRFVLRAGNPVRGMWDADRLRRALWSLAANAIKHGDRDAPVTISVEAQATGAELGVHNAGRSIYPDQQARLFRPFSRERLRSHKPG